MSKGLGSLIADGSTNYVIRRPGGHSALLPVTVATGGGGSTPINPFIAFDPANYANDSAFRAVIQNNISTSVYPGLAGTGSGSVPIFNDGSSCDLISWQATGGPTGGPCLRATIYGRNDGASATSPQLFILFGGGSNVDIRPKSVWMYRQVLFESGFVTYGDADSGPGISFNNGQAYGYKAGPYVFYQNADGRGGVSFGGGSRSYPQTVDMDISAGPSYNSVNSGLLDSHIYSYTLENDTFWDELVYYKQFIGSDGKCWVQAATWRKRVNEPDSSYARLGPMLTARMDTVWGSPPDGIQRISGCQFTSKNYNQSRKTNVYARYGKFFVYEVEAAGNADPFGVLALDAAQTPITPGSVASASQAGGVVQLAVQLSRQYPYRDASYARVLRPYIDGVAQGGQDYTLKPEERCESCTTERANGLYVQDNRNMTVTIPVTVTSGTHVVGVKAVSGDGTHISALSPTISVTV